MTESQQIDVSSIPRRDPVISEKDEKDFRIKELDDQWRIVTEVGRRALIEDPKVRAGLVEFCVVPVDETLPGKFGSYIASADDRSKRFLDRYKKNLVRYLSLPTVPDDLLVPDLLHASELVLPEYVASRRSLGSELDRKRMQDFIDSQQFLRGITPQERSLVLRRYQWARDVKLLALGAEILIVDEEGLQGKKIGETVEYELPSGIKLVATTSEQEKVDDLLHPELWEKRRQLKDRVYEISVNGRKYILKEKKTARHKDTKRGGHIESLTAQEEFEAAQFFGKEGRVRDDKFWISWEKPIGFVMFPDGFQFTVFDYEEGLRDPKKDDTLWEIAKGILDNEDQFRAEFEKVASGYQDHMDDDFVRQFKVDEGEDASSEFTFLDFALVKAYRLDQVVPWRLKELVIDLGYTNSDQDGYMYRFNSAGGFILEAVGFDFEYFQKLTPEEIEELKEYKDDWQRHKKLLEKYISVSSIGEYSYNNRKLQAAYQALLDVEKGSEKVTSS